ncbi:M48 family metallopeptidase [bacterium]|nr:M48 family metallopeptidase [bacterium]
MKRFIILFFALFVFNNCVTEAATQYTESKVTTIGQKVLTENNLPKEVTFNVVESETINAYADTNNNIVIYTGLLNLLEKDEELAGIMSHEIGHIMKSHCYKQTFFKLALSIIISKITNQYAAVGAEVASGFASNKVSREHEYDADYTSADLLHKAGYNTLGLISALNKISDKYIDVLSDHPSGDKRLMALYDYINYNYPDDVKKGYSTNSYKSFLETAKTTIDKRNNDSKTYEKYLNTQKKLKEKRDKAAQKMMKTNDPWATGYSTLMLMVGSEN